MKIMSSLLTAAAFCAATGAALAATPNAPGMRGQIATPSKAGSSLLLSYSPSFGGIIVQKNVASVTELTTGVFCVAPQKKLPKGSLPVVTVEWGQSSGNSLLAFYENGVFDCPAGQIEVRTFDFNAGGSPVASDLVAFDVNVQ